MNKNLSFEKELHDTIKILRLAISRDIIMCAKSHIIFLLKEAEYKKAKKELLLMLKDVDKKVRAVALDALVEIESERLNKNK